MDIASSSRQDARYWVGWQNPGQSFLASHLLPMVPRREDDATFCPWLSDRLRQLGPNSNTSHRRAVPGPTHEKWLLKVRKPAYWVTLDTKEIFGASEQVLLKASNHAHRPKYIRPTRPPAHKHASAPSPKPDALKTSSEPHSSFQSRRHLRQKYPASCLAGSSSVSSHLWRAGKAPRERDPAE